MSRPISDIFHIQDIPNAGRGVIALISVLNDTIILRTSPPAVHVIHHEYRKEVCAQCFHYDLGRELKFRDISTGRVFCSAECQTLWLREQTELGIEAWEALHKFVKSKGKAISNQHGLPTTGSKPSVEEIEVAWRLADEEARRMESRREACLSKLKERSVVQSLPKHTSKTVDPDILSLFLSGALLAHHSLQKWKSDILALETAAQPYRSTPDLEAHCKSFLQLSAILPAVLSQSLTAETCRTLIAAETHNAFGIRDDSEDGDEYMGYGIWPEASYFNHSCNPNVARKRVGQVWQFRVIREVEVGEECCISYLGGEEKELSVDERRKRLREVWEFDCACQRCFEAETQ